MQGYHVVDWLNTDGQVSATILHTPDTYQATLPSRAWWILASLLIRRIDILLFQKIAGATAHRLMRVSRLLGKHIVFVDCDYRSSYYFQDAVDSFVAPSEAMADHIRRETGRECAVIPDAVEYWRAPQDAAFQPPLPSAPLRMVWVGAEPNFYQIEPLLDQLANTGGHALTITTISTHPRSDILWQLADMPDVLFDFDAAIIPAALDDYARMKSVNRATLFMALSIPLVVEDSLVYSGIVRHGENALVYRSMSELLENCDQLRNSEKRRRLVENGYQTALNFHMDRIGPKWREMLLSLAPQVA